MLAKRIIPCLDVSQGRVVKGVEFKNLVDIEAPEVLAKFYCDQGADELVFYDITATSSRQGIFCDLVSSLSEVVNIPLCVGGGVNCLDDFDRLLRAGADKVSINSSGVYDPDLISRAASKYGNQCVVVSIDAKYMDGDYYVLTHGGRKKTGLLVKDWAIEAVKRGAGELVLNSINEDGKKEGFDLDLLQLVGPLVQVPIITSGGAGGHEDFLKACPYADGLLAASVFHDKSVVIRDLKAYLDANNIRVRRCI